MASLAASAHHGTPAQAIIGEAQKVVACMRLNSRFSSMRAPIRTTQQQQASPLLRSFAQLRESLSPDTGTDRSLALASSIHCALEQLIDGMHVVILHQMYERWMLTCT